MGPRPMNDILTMNYFDAAIYVCLFVAVVMGFMSGLLRSLATIFGYIAAMAIAVAVAPQVSTFTSDVLKFQPPDMWLLVTGIFLVVGILVSALLRFTVSEMVSPTISIPDRIAGALFGVARIGLLAVVLVLVFDRIIPPGREPAFLKGSRWRPVLSVAAQHGLKTLPHDVEAYIDRLKRARGI
jgi:membrane protein required for colicin V production